MSRRYWVLTVAILLATLGPIYAWLNQDNYCLEPPSLANYELEIASWTRGSDFYDQPPRTDPESYRAEQHRQQNLAAQQKMACATYWAMCAAWIGVFLLSGTLYEAFRTAGAAETAISDARENAQRELRAYVTLNKVEITQFEAGKPLLVRIPMSNTGQTPALEYRGWFWMDIVSNSKIQTYRYRKQSAYSRYTLGPGVEASAYEASINKWVLTEAEYAEVISGLSSLLVWGRDYYRDVFGKTHITSFRYEHTGPVVQPQRMRVCAGGNKTT